MTSSRVLERLSHRAYNAGDDGVAVPQIAATLPVCVATLWYGSGVNTALSVDTATVGHASSCDSDVRVEEHARDLEESRKSTIPPPPETSSHPQQQYDNVPSATVQGP